MSLHLWLQIDIHHWTFRIYVNQDCWSLQVDRSRDHESAWGKLQFHCIVHKRKWYLCIRHDSSRSNFGLYGLLCRVTEQHQHIQIFKGKNLFHKRRDSSIIFSVLNSGWLNLPPFLDEQKDLQELIHYCWHKKAISWPTSREVNTILSLNLWPRVHCWRGYDGPVRLRRWFGMVTWVRRIGM